MMNGEIVAALKRERKRLAKALKATEGVLAKVERLQAGGKGGKKKRKAKKTAGERVADAVVARETKGNGSSKATRGRKPKAAPSSDIEAKRRRIRELRGTKELPEAAS